MYSARTFEQLTPLQGFRTLTGIPAVGVWSYGGFSLSGSCRIISTRARERSECAQVSPPLLTCLSRHASRSLNMRAISPASSLLRALSLARRWMDCQSRRVSGSAAPLALACCAGVSGLGLNPLAGHRPVWKTHTIYNLAHTHTHTH